MALPMDLGTSGSARRLTSMVGELTLRRVGFSGSRPKQDNDITGFSVNNAIM